MLSIQTQFLSNRSQHVMVDGCRSKLVNVVSGVPQCSVLFYYCSCCALLAFFYILKNKLVGYADDSNLMGLCHPQALELQ